MFLFCFAAQVLDLDCTVKSKLEPNKYNVQQKHDSRVIRVERLRAVVHAVRYEGFSELHRAGSECVERFDVCVRVVAIFASFL